MSREHDPKHDVERKAAASGPDFDAEHDSERARRVSNAGLRREVQKRTSGGPSTEAVHDAAARGVASSTTALPYADQIQSSFGPDHDVSKIQAHVGGDSAQAMGANAYATGNHVVFDRSPDLHTAAHETAHVVQQAHGVNLYGGVGEAGDSYERHADAVADRVVTGKSASDLLGPAGGAGSRAVQMDTKKKLSDATADQQEKQHEKAETSSFQGMESELKTAAARFHELADQVVDTSRAPLGPGGYGQKADILRALFTRAQSEMTHISAEIGAQPAGPGLTHLLAPDVKKLNGGFVEFNQAWLNAQYKIKQDQEQKGVPESSRENLDGQLADWIYQTLRSINAHVDITDPKASVNADVHGLGKSEDHRKEAISDNLRAAQDASQSVRMGLTTGKPDVVKADLQRAVAALRILDNELKSDLKVAKTYKQAVAPVIKEIESLEKDGGSKFPELKDPGGIPWLIKNIKSHVGL